LSSILVDEPGTERQDRRARMAASIASASMQAPSIY
jgi:hypothetical protein